MDWVAGTRDGITAFKWISRSGITAEILTEALAQAKARFEILDVIEATRFPSSVQEWKPAAPKGDTIKIDVDKIKIVIGRVEKPSIRLSLKQALRLISTKSNVSIYSATKMPSNRAKKSL